MYFNIRPLLLEIPYIERGYKEMGTIHGRNNSYFSTGSSLAFIVFIQNEINVRLTFLNGLHAIKVYNPLLVFLTASVLTGTGLRKGENVLVGTVVNDVGEFLEHLERTGLVG